MSSMQTITVRQLNIYVKSLLENDVKLAGCRISGEITNFKCHYASGHLYFTLSDGFAAIKCVMFKGYAAKCKIPLKNGVKVVVTGRVSIYEKDGGYQLYAEAVDEDGVGDKLLALKMLKEKLAAQGLFDTANKRKPVLFPRRVAVITSGTGAALQDIINVISRRYPVCQLVLSSASVQGELAVKELIFALEKVYSADGIDTIIIGRGGGSAEDLDAFNSEALARKVYESPVPIISAVGHETDITVCDMVADLRAPTPSAAAELAVPDKSFILRNIETALNTCSNSLLKKCDNYDIRLAGLLSRPVLKNPYAFIDEKSVLLDRITDNINMTVNTVFDKKDAEFSALIQKLDALSPMKTMSRGYSFVLHGKSPIHSVDEVEIGDNLSVLLADGNIECRVTNKESKFYEI